MRFQASLSLAVMALTGAADAAAQASPLETVIVTAQRRAENLAEVPMSVSALKDEGLDWLAASGRDIRMLAARTPSLHVESDFGRSFPRFYLRGLGNTDFDMNAAQPVSVVFDEVVQESPLLKGFPLFDVDQAEVLRGPQGTLFGRNAPGGVVKFASKTPVFAREGYAALGTGNFGIVNAEGALNVPLGDTVALRASLQGQHRDHRVFNPRPAPATPAFEGYHDNAARLQLLVQPGADFSALANVHGRRMAGRATVFRANIIRRGSNDLVPGFDYAALPTDGINRQWLHTRGASLRLRWALPGMALHAVSGFEAARFYSRGDVDGGYGAASSPPMGPGAIPFTAETADGLPQHRQLTQEVRLESTAPGPWSWLGGLYYFNEKIGIDSFNFDTLAGNRQNAYAYQRQNSRSWAAFGSLGWRPVASLNLRAGLRHTRDDKDFLAARPQPAPGGAVITGLAAHPHSTNLSWDTSALWTVAPATRLYARVATGYRAPSIQGRILFGNTISVAKAERALSWEGGVRHEWLQRRARASFGLFGYRVRDMQLTAGSGAVNQNRLVNASRVTGQGAEAELQWRPGDAWLASAGASYTATAIRDPGLFVLPCGNGCTVLDPKGGPGATSVSVAGNPLPRAPRWLANASVRHAMPVAAGEAYLAGDLTYRGRYNFFLYEAKEYRAKPLLETGLRLGYRFGQGKHEVAFFVRNLANRVVAVNAIDFNNMTGVVSEPRIVGVQWRGAY
jgi:iron complex outermembrane receptor protein